MPVWCYEYPHAGEEYASANILAPQLLAPLRTLL